MRIKEFSVLYALLSITGDLAFVSILCASILIVLLIWLKVNNKGIFAIDEEE